MIHWLATAISTYLLHPMHGDGYQFWSGAGSDLGEATILSGIGVLYLRHNCHVKGCWRIGRRNQGDLLLCHKHHPKSQPRASEIK